MLQDKRTKIVCTLGPASDTKEQVTQMVAAGMNVARLNFSHGTYEHHTSLIRTVRSVAKDTGKPLAILQDLQGPKIRVGTMPEEGILLETDAEYLFDTSIDTYTEDRIPVDYAALHTYMSVGDRLLISDGIIETEVMSIAGTCIHVRVLAGGMLFSHKGINVPDSHIDARAMTQKDKEDAQFGISQGVDMIALSFVRSAADIEELRSLIVAHQSDDDVPIKIIAKIERPEAVAAIEDILDAADGIMIARGDLGIEVPAAKVPLIQKEHIALARAKGVPVIVATQMLDSMQSHPRATRAEVSDVANAVIDHADALMLSNETATGAYPVKAVSTMTQIIQEAEASPYDDVDMNTDVCGPYATQIHDVLAQAKASHERVSALVIPEGNSDLVHKVSACRPEVPLVVVASTQREAHQLALLWSVVPVQAPSLDACLAYIQEHASAPGAYIVLNMNDEGELVFEVCGEDDS